MPDHTFYVGAQDDKGRLSGFVSAKFLMRNGRYVADPTPGGSQGVFLYSDATGNNKTHGSIANPNNYLIVPANYDDQQAADFATGISDTLNRVYPEDETGTAGPHLAREQMIEAFRQGGSQDLQRHPQWGVPRGSFVPAFVGSASNHLGYVTASAGLPKIWSEIGGGALNEYHHWSQPVIDNSGPYGLSRQNSANISEGYSDALVANRPLASFNNYGHGKPPQGVGGGSGISPFSESLAGIDPDQAAPPAWPPQPGAAVRYLSSRRVRY